MKNFIKDCLRTESLPEHRPILINKSVYDRLFKTIDEVIEVNNRLNELKKIIFYGEETEVKSPVHVVLSLRQYRLLHAAMGVSTESAELLEAGLKDDTVNLVEEGGDVMWYLSILFDELDTSFTQAGNTVIKKLQVRYPEKFNSDEAWDRDLDAERNMLEQCCGDDSEDHF